MCAVADSGEFLINPQMHQSSSLVVTLCASHAESQGLSQTNYTATTFTVFNNFICKAQPLFVWSGKRFSRLLCICVALCFIRVEIENGFLGYPSPRSALLRVECLCQWISRCGSERSGGWMEWFLHKASQWLMSPYTFMQWSILIHLKDIVYL